jgi:hypothetical protein
MHGGGEAWREMPPHTLVTGIARRSSLPRICNR